MRRLAFLITTISLLLHSGCGSEEVGFHGVTDGNPAAQLFLMQGEIGERYLFDSEKISQAFTQDGEEPKLDLLIVMDNSGSMRNIQENMAQRMGPLLRYIADSDWQIGVATTDRSDSCLVGILRRGDANLNTRFPELMQQGTSGTPQEMGIYTAVRALQMGGNCTSEPWVREDSIVAVLIISDEDNCSNGLRRNSDCAGQPHQRAEYLTDYLSSIRTLGETARVYGLISIPGTFCPRALQSGDVYMTAISRTNGQAGSICDNNYSATLERISRDIASVLNTRFELTHSPAPASVRVLVDGIAIPGSQIQINGNTIRLAQTPAPGSTVEISYEPVDYTGETSFSIRKGYEGELIVMLDGKFLDEEDYIVDREQGSLELLTEVGMGGVLVVFYGREAIVRREFSVPAGLDQSGMRITVAGREVTDFSYDKEKGVLRFEGIPPEGAEIRVSYR